MTFGPGRYSILKENPDVMGFNMGFGWGEILLILLLALLLFGARKIPEIARSLGKGIGEFKKGLNDIQDEPKKTSNDAEKKK